MSDRESRSTPLSRRSVIGGTAALPVLSGLSTPEVYSVTTQCAQWLAVNSEIESLTLRWAKLDAYVMSQSRGLRQSSARRRPAHLIKEMEAIDRRLDPLFESRDSGLESLAKRPARTLNDVAGKLTVAACMLDGEGGPIHDIVAEAASILG